MSSIVTKDTIKKSHQKCLHELNQFISLKMPKEDQAFKFSDPTFLSVLAWQILVPLFVSITGGLVVNKFSVKNLKHKPLSSLKQDLESTLGKEINLKNKADLEECIILVEGLLKPLGIKRQQARDIVTLLTSSLN